IGLSKCGSVVRSVAGHRNKLSLGLLALDESHLIFRLRFCEEIVNARLTCDSRCGERVVAGNHHRPYTHGPQMIESFLHSSLDDVCEGDHSKDSAVLTNKEWRAATIRNLGDRVFHFRRHILTALGAMPCDRIFGPFSNFKSVEINA